MAKILCNFAILDASLAFAARASAAAAAAAPATRSDAPHTAKVGVGSGGVVCEACEEAPAAHRCAECAQFMCEMCTKAHRRMKVSMSHTVQSMEDFLAGGTPVRTVQLFCAAHPAPSPLHELSLVCRTCDLTPICRDCIVVDHRDHDYTFLASVAAEQRTELLELARAAEARSDAAATAIAAIETVRTEVDAAAAHAEARIGAAFAAVRAELNIREEAAQRAVLAITGQKRKVLEGQREAVAMLQASIDSGVSFVQRAVRSSTDTEVMLSRPAIVRRLRELVAADCSPTPAASAHMEVADDTSSALAALRVLGDVFTVDASMFTATGVGVEGPIHATGGEVAFAIRPLERSGGVRDLHTLPFDAQVRLPWDDEPSTVAVTSADDGTFIGRYTPAPPAGAAGGSGDGRCDVTLFGTPLPGSPFLFPVFVGRVATGSGGARAVPLPALPPARFHSRWKGRNIQVCCNG